MKDSLLKSTEQAIKLFSLLSMHAFVTPLEYEKYTALLDENALLDSNFEIEEGLVKIKLDDSHGYLKKVERQDVPSFKEQLFGYTDHLSSYEYKVQVDFKNHFSAEPLIFLAMGTEHILIDESSRTYPLERLYEDFVDTSNFILKFEYIGDETTKFWTIAAKYYAVNYSGISFEKLLLKIRKLLEP